MRAAFASYRKQELPNVSKLGTCSVLEWVSAGFFCLEVKQNPEAGRHEKSPNVKIPTVESPKNRPKLRPIRI